MKATVNVVADALSPPPIPEGAPPPQRQDELRLEPEVELPPVTAAPASEPDPPRPLDKPPGCDCSLPSASECLAAALLGVAVGCLAAYLLGPRRGVAMSAACAACPAPYRQLSIGEISTSSGA